MYTFGRSYFSVAIESVDERCLFVRELLQIYEPGVILVIYRSITRSKHRRRKLTHKHDVLKTEIVRTYQMSQ